MKQYSAVLFSLILLFGGAYNLSNASSENIDPEGLYKIGPGSALEFLIRNREDIKKDIRNSLENSSATEKIVSFHDPLPLKNGWYFIHGGSFAMCSDDIAFMALFHPGKNIIRFLFAARTGTVENGLYLINQANDKVIVGHECLGMKAPERFLFENGIPVRDRIFNQAFERAFSDLLKTLGKDDLCNFSRHFSFDPGGNFCLSMKIFSSLGEEIKTIDMKFVEKPQSDRKERQDAPFVLIIKN